MLVALTNVNQWTLL